MNSLGSSEPGASPQVSEAALACSQRQGSDREAGCSPSTPLWLGHGEVPRRLLGAFPHCPHEAREAHVLGLLQASHKTLLHYGNKLLVAQLAIPCEKRRKHLTLKPTNNLLPTCTNFKGQQPQVSVLAETEGTFSFNLPEYPAEQPQHLNPNPADAALIHLASPCPAGPGALGPENRKANAKQMPTQPQETALQMI